MPHNPAQTSACPQPNMEAPSATTPLWPHEPAAAAPRFAVVVAGVCALLLLAPLSFVARPQPRVQSAAYIAPAAARKPALNGAMRSDVLSTPGLQHMSPGTFAPSVTQNPVATDGATAAGIAPALERISTWRVFQNRISAFLLGALAVTSAAVLATKAMCHQMASPLAQHQLVSMASIAASEDEETGAERRQQVDPHEPGLHLSTAVGPFHVGGRALVDNLFSFVRSFFG